LQQVKLLEYKNKEALMISYEPTEEVVYVRLIEVRQAPSFCTCDQKDRVGTVIDIYA
jgi:hypothetical protein